jgi:glycosyltransferase involved in cell wall biosynthesis
MSKKPRVSVITIFLNEEKFIREAIESVFAQTYDDWELLLVDDGSTDASTEIAKQHAAQHGARVRYLDHDRHANKGMSATRNLGVRHSRGEFIALLDADDVWLPRKLERQVAILESQPRAAMVYGAPQYWYGWTGKPEDLKLDCVAELGIRPDTLFDPPTLLTLLYPLGPATAPCPSDLLLRRELIERVGGFEESFTGKYQLYEDQAFLAKVYLNEGVFVSSECWDRYRIHPDSCVSVVTQAGEYHSVRAFFLRWLDAYLSQQGDKGNNVSIVRQQILEILLRATVQTQQEILRNSENQISQLLAEKESLVLESVRLKETLDRIYASHGWAVLQRYYQGRNKLFPINSQTRSAAKALWNQAWRLLGRVSAREGRGSS